nr:leucine zipper domain-containing protein [Hyphomonas sp. BRH_c22]
MDVVSGRLTPSAAARAHGVCCKTVLRWVAQFRRLAPGGMTDKSSRPDRLHQPGTVLNFVLSAFFHYQTTTCHRR